MQDYVIDVSEVDELQTLNNIDQLESIFSKAKSAIVNGAKVQLIRKNFLGKAEKFDEMGTEDELFQYKKQIMKYLIK